MDAAIENLLPPMFAEEQLAALPAAGPHPPLTVPCPVGHEGLLGRGQVQAKLADGSIVRQKCRICRGRGWVLTDFGYEVASLVSTILDEKE